eukprot:3113870-Rhodomonas_salina.1
MIRGGPTAASNRNTSKQSMHHHFQHLVFGHIQDQSRGSSGIRRRGTRRDRFGGKQTVREAARGAKTPGATGKGRAGIWGTILFVIPRVAKSNALVEVWFHVCTATNLIRVDFAEREEGCIAYMSGGQPVSELSSNITQLFDFRAFSAEFSLRAVRMLGANLKADLWQRGREKRSGEGPRLHSKACPSILPKLHC